MNRIRSHPLVLVLLSFLAAPVAFGQTASAKVVAGSEHCREIHFPGGWKPTKDMKKAYLDHFIFGGLYEFRTTAALSHEYLVAALEDDVASPKEYSVNKFWVNFRSGKVRDATQGEWDRAWRVPQSRSTKAAFFQLQGNEAISFEGKPFPKSGPAVATFGGASASFA